MIQLFPGLWQTRDEHPFESMPEAVHNAYLVTRPSGNVLIHSPGPLRTHAEDYEHIRDMGGVSHHVITHYHEAGEAARDVRNAFNSKCCCHADDSVLAERKGTKIDIAFGAAIDGLPDFEVLHTPGHTPGSTCILYAAPHGSTYLFAGETIVPARDGWIAKAFSDGDERQLYASLERLKAVTADVVIGASAVATRPYVSLAPDQWMGVLDDAQRRLEARNPEIGRN